MHNERLSKIFACTIIGLLLLAPVEATAQTRVEPPKNKYKIQDDIKLGADAARDVEKQFPILNDADATAYLERVGRRLVASIPPQYRQPAFQYRFKIVNASDLNAFALPGGPMYVNRGMIEKAERGRDGRRHGTRDQPRRSAMRPRRRQSKAASAISLECSG